MATSAAKMHMNNTSVQQPHCRASSVYADTPFPLYGLLLVELLGHQESRWLDTDTVHRGSTYASLAGKHIQLLGASGASM